MRPEGNNPLDLNNLPDDHQYSRDGKQVLLEDMTSSPGGCSSRKKKNGGKDGKDVECGKVYECRFCSLKFCKSQALGGHMNRHRQERETETLNHARQLVFRNDHTVVAAQGAPHLGCCPPIASAAGYHNHPAAGNMVGDPPPAVQLPPLRFPRYFSSSGSSSTSTPMPPPPLPSQPYLYTSPPRPMSFPTHLIPHQQQNPIMNDYHVGHVMSMSSSSSSGHPNYGHHPNMNYAAAAAAAGESNYTCIGAPVGQGGFMGSSGGRGLDNINGGGKDGGGSVVLQQQNQEEGLNWGRSYPSSGAVQHRLDPPSAINRYQDGF